MDITQLFWLLILATALQPLLRQRFLEASRSRLIAKIEKARGSRVILMVHRQETMALLGFPLMRYIDVHDSEQILRAIEMTDDNVPIDLVMHTPGGLVLAAVQIARALKAHPAKVTVFVPHYAMSGGTLIALAAQEVVMSPFAVLGPVDPQLGQLPAASLLRLVREKSIDQIDDESLILADQAEKAVRQLTAVVRELLGDRMALDQATELAEILSEGRWTHDYPITAEQARAFGLNITTNMPTDIVRMMNLFPQPVRRQGAVEYLPGRRSRPPGNGEKGGRHQ